MITLTPAASEKVKELLAQKDEAFALRVFIKSGGCSGFSYGMALDMKKDEDILEEQHGVKVVLDPQSAPFLSGAEIDFVDDITGTGFKIHNPNAVSTCGCGSSFHTKDDAGQPGACS
ncbi:iron-sulfur cluster assembly accessory protein [Fodinisporobacter ferrooxydans]|uniref:Iron-sulfur cluster assembly accessory protein n=1 Tax=Fodinisporobacter ferrooxydans TaxID=2901836 RepID=A0ABY4CJD6_9BACL|nr:iron-sulfur cluster assembly accessory protein [Alicyclobacillaceae bacterium MYW30-H2]